MTSWTQKKSLKWLKSRYYINVSKHPRISELSALYEKLVKMIRTLYNPLDVEKWFKAVNDEIATKGAK